MVSAHSSTAAIDKLLDERFAKLEDKFQTQFADFTKQLQTQLPNIFASVFGNSPEGVGASNALSGVLGNLLNGNNDARTLANSAAQGFAPVIGNYFNSSGAQIGEDLLSFITRAQRNL